MTAHTDSNFCLSFLGKSVHNYMLLNFVTISHVFFPEIGSIFVELYLIYYSGTQNCLFFGEKIT